MFKKNKNLIDWLKAILYAFALVVIIISYIAEPFNIPTTSMEKTLQAGDFILVSKVEYGPRVPTTLFQFPFIGKSISFLDNIKMPYIRIPGFGKIKNNDIVAFNYPKEDIKNLDNKTPFVKRCIGIPGDIVEIKAGLIYVNHKVIKELPKVQHNYLIKTKKDTIDAKLLDKYGINEGGRFMHENMFFYAMTDSASRYLSKQPDVLSIRPMTETPNSGNGELFSYKSKKWNVDNYGQIKVPKKGDTVSINDDNLPIYEEIIRKYEKNKLEQKNGVVYINDKQTTEYVIKMNYYFMMGDNRHNSIDTRFWGFVPEDHVIGKVVFVWLSLDKTKSFFSSIRWNRICRIPD